MGPGGGLETLWAPVVGQSEKISARVTSRQARALEFPFRIQRGRYTVCSGAWVVCLLDTPTTGPDSRGAEGKLLLGFAINTFQKCACKQYELTDRVCDRSIFYTRENECKAYLRWDSSWEGNIMPPSMCINAWHCFVNTSRGGGSVDMVRMTRPIRKQRVIHVYAPWPTVDEYGKGLGTIQMPKLRE